MQKSLSSHWLLIAMSVGALCNSSLANDARLATETRIRSLMLEIAQREKNGASAGEIAVLQAACDTLTEELATPPSPRSGFAERTSDTMPPAPLFGTLPPGTSATTSVFSGGGGAISDTDPTFSVINVSGLDPYLWDVDVGASIQHTACRDLVIRVTAPSGKLTFLSIRRGGDNDNVFSMTWWDDDASELTTDTIYSNNTNNPLLIPEGALATFVGENPNGAWTFRVSDLGSGGTGTLVSWNLRLTTLSPSPSNAATQTFANFTAIDIPDREPNIVPVTSTIAVSMPGTCICDLDLRTFIKHTYCGDLRFWLRSPLGTEVLVSSRNGDDFVDVFDGTSWDDDATIPVTNTDFIDNVTATPVTAEGAFGAFHGENPNGIWTFKIQDESTADKGRLDLWALTITTCASPLVETFCFGDGSGTQCPCHNNSPLGSKRGCLNGLGRGAKLTGVGGQSVSGDTVQLLTEDTPFRSYVLYWQSRYSPNMGLGSRFDDGLLCAQTPVVFLGSRFTNSSLQTHFPEGGTPLHVLGNIPPEGGTRFIQCWYRNAGSVCGTYSNLTNGVKVNWVP